MPCAAAVGSPRVSRTQSATTNRNHQSSRARAAPVLSGPLSRPFVGGAPWPGRSARLTAPSPRPRRAFSVLGPHLTEGFPKGDVRASHVLRRLEDWRSIRRAYFIGPLLDLLRPLRELAHRREELRAHVSHVRRGCLFA